MVVGKKDGLYLYYDWLKPLKKVETEYFKDLIIAMLEYHQNGKEPPQFEGYADMAADFIFSQIARSKQYAENGSKGGAATQSKVRASTNGSTIASTNGSNLKHKHKTNTNTKTNTDNDISPSPEGEIETENAFNQFWEAYPKKVAKKEAQKAFEKIKPDTILLDTILVAIQAQKQSGQWQDKQYIPNPATWLRRGQWEDELPPRREGSFDIDDFFNAAVAHTYGEGEQKADKA